MYMHGGALVTIMIVTTTTLERHFSRHSAHVAGDLFHVAGLCWQHKCLSLLCVPRTL